MSNVATQRYGLTYTTGSLPRQVGSAWKKVVRLSLPSGFIDKMKRARTPGDAAATIATLRPASTPTSRA